MLLEEEEEEKRKKKENSLALPLGKTAAAYLV